MKNYVNARKKRLQTEQGLADYLVSAADVARNTCRQRLSRRLFVGGGVTLTAYTAAEQLLFPLKLQAQTSYAPQRKLIWISLNGGWDLLEATDPKPASTSGIDMVYGWGDAHALAGSADVRLGRWLPNIANQGEDVVVVRGLAMGTTSHEAGSIYMDTGVLSNAGLVNAASIPAIVASESQATIPIIQLNGGADPKADRGLLNPISVVRADNLELYRSMYPETDAELESRLLMLDYMQKSAQRLSDVVGENDRLSSLSVAQEKVREQFAGQVGQKLSLTDEDRAYFNVGAPTNLQTGSRDAVALVLKLIKNDLCTCINLGFGGFDTHQSQTARLQPILTNVDYLISRLVDGLREEGKLNDTLIVLYSDFGRTPKVNGSNGRDHWPTGGAIVIGGGLEGSRAVGATDDSLNAVNLVNPNTGASTTDSSIGVQLNPTHLGGMILDLTLGSGYRQYRPYLESIPALIRLKAS